MFSADLGVTPSANYIEDVFSTYLYTGNGSTQTITNGIDLSGKGGLVWLKNRTGTYSHWLWDTARGAGYSLNSNGTGASANIGTTEGVSFSSTGFSFGNNINWNESNTTAVSWTFRKQAKFFDIVTYTGNGTTQAISHNLGSTPGCIIVKSTSAVNDWRVYHRSLATADSALRLNSTAAAGSSSTFWNSTAPTSTQFTVGSDGSVNASGATYVAYLFAHDAGGFGAAGSDNVISCGSVVLDGAGNGNVTLGYEPQWVLAKQSSATSSWELTDTMRGMPVNGNTSFLQAQSSSAEDVTSSSTFPTSTGFKVSGASFSAGATVIYIAIRRGPMKTPTSGTSVFTPDAAGNNASANGMAYDAGFPVDLSISGDKSGVNKFFAIDRLRGGSKFLTTTSTVAEADTPYANKLDNMTGVATQDAFNFTGRCAWMFRRAPGFFDEVCYTGTGGDSSAKNHNLAVIPELIIIKNRSSATDWPVWTTGFVTGSGPSGSSQYLLLNTTAATATNTGTNQPFGANPTTTTFTVGNWSRVNDSGQNYVAYLFASCPGVSKVGSYTGSGTTKQIDCGFTGGARFVLIKRTDSTGDWYVWDSARGIVAGNDPYLLLNSTAAEVTSTDYVDTYSAGFEISSTAPAAINANGGSFIFLAIA